MLEHDTSGASNHDCLSSQAASANLEPLYFYSA